MRASDNQRSKNTFSPLKKGMFLVFHKWRHTYFCTVSAIGTFGCFAYVESSQYPFPLMLSMESPKEHFDESMLVSWFKTRVKALKVISQINQAFNLVVLTTFGLWQNKSKLNYNLFFLIKDYFPLESNHHNGPLLSNPFLEARQSYKKLPLKDLTSQ